MTGHLRTGAACAVAALGLLTAVPDRAEAATLTITHSGTIELLMGSGPIVFDPAIDYGVEASIVFTFDIGPDTIGVLDEYLYTDLNTSSASASFVVDGRVIYTVEGTGFSNLMATPGEGANHGHTAIVGDNPLGAPGAYSLAYASFGNPGWSPSFFQPFSFVPDADENIAYFTIGNPDMPAVMQTIGLATTRVTASGLATAAVPEPATWAMMIGGFGLVGGTMRRRRAAGRTVTA